MEALTRTLRRPKLLRLALFALLVCPSALVAHRLDEYLQATLVAIEPRDVRLQIDLTPGVAVAAQLLALIDRDRNGVISPREGAAYAESLKRDLTVRLDRRILGLRLTASSFPALAELRDGTGIIRLDFSVAAGPIAPGAHQLTLENRHLPRMSVYLLNAALPRSGSVRITRQTRNADQSVGTIEFTVSPGAGTGNR